MWTVINIVHIISIGGIYRHAVDTKRIQKVSDGQNLAHWLIMWIMRTRRVIDVVDPL